MITNISIIIPSYNEAENINEMYTRLKSTLNNLNIIDYEIIYIENGSSDDSMKILRELNKKDKSLKVISFSRNFGLQNAIHAGLSFSTKDFVCVMACSDDSSDVQSGDISHHVVLVVTGNARLFVD